MQEDGITRSKKFCIAADAAYTYEKLFEYFYLRSDLRFPPPPFKLVNFELPFVLFFKNSFGEEKKKKKEISEKIDISCT